MTTGEHPMIVGGSVVAAGDPTTVSTVGIVGQTTQGQYICTGSLIAQDMVVTAAHCLDGTQPDSIRVIFARNMQKSTADQQMPIAGYAVNSNYQGESATGPDQADIGVIRLAEPLPAGYAPAQLMTLAQTNALSKGDSVLLAGYGITSAFTQAGAGTLRKVSVPVFGPLGSTEEILDQTGDKGGCNGDSGGPAFVNDGGQLLLWGLTNRSYPDDAPNTCESYAVYTKIAAYSDWIAGAENALRNPQPQQ
jgi:secreted trypsin-like serine protease